jgi:hypothetical protein
MPPMKTNHRSDRISESVPAGPEFCDAKLARLIFGFSRAHLYNLTAEGKIRSACIRRPGAFRGRRLWCCQSIRDFLRANMEEA